MAGTSLADKAREYVVGFIACRNDLEELDAAAAALGDTADVRQLRARISAGKRRAERVLKIFGVLIDNVVPLSAFRGEGMELLHQLMAEGEPTMKTYVGRRDFAGKIEVKILESGRPLPTRFDLMMHSPLGYEWGYGGSGPAQLALALLADALGDDQRALRLHQAFKFAVVSRLPSDEWRLTRRDVLAAVEDIDREDDIRI